MVRDAAGGKGRGFLVFAEQQKAVLGYWYHRGMGMGLSLVQSSSEY